MGQGKREKEIVCVLGKIWALEERKIKRKKNTEARTKKHCHGGYRSCRNYEKCRQEQHRS